MLKGEINMTDNVVEIPINKIRPAIWQPRERFDKTKLQELGNSIKELGLIQPITVRKQGDGYQIIAGERRWRAWELTGKPTIPAVIKDVNDFEAKEISFAENYQREDLSDIEKEKFIFELYTAGINKRYSSIRDIERRTGIPESTIRGLLESYNVRIEMRNASALPCALPLRQVIEEVSTQDIQVTKPIESNPEARLELLRIRIESPEKLSQSETRTVAKAVCEVNTEQQVPVIHMVGEGKLESKDLLKFVSVLKKSSPEVQEKLLKSEITTEDAEDINLFTVPEQQKQVLEEKVLFREGVILSKQELEINDKANILEKVELAAAIKQGKVPIIKIDNSKITTEEFDFKTFQTAFLTIIGFNASYVKYVKIDALKRQYIKYLMNLKRFIDETLIQLGE